MKSTIKTRENAQGVLDYLTQHPQQHDQNNWWSAIGTESTSDITEDNFCGTTMCIAGCSVYMAEGLQGLRDAVDHVDAVNEEIRQHIYDNDYEDGDYLDPDEIWVKKGREHLGLSDKEARSLFFTFNDEQALDALRAVAQGDEVKFNNIINDPEGVY